MTELHYIEPRPTKLMYLFTEIQLRNWEIYVTFKAKREEGVRREEIIQELMQRYNLSRKSIEVAVYPSTK